MFDILNTYKVNNFVTKSMINTNIAFYNIKTSHNKIYKHEHV